MGREFVKKKFYPEFVYGMHSCDFFEIISGTKSLVAVVTVKYQL